MTPSTTPPDAPRTVDLTGLPEAVVEEVECLVREARERQAAPPDPRGVIGRFAHLGIKTPTLEEFQEARRELWSNAPDDFPPGEGP